MNKITSILLTVFGLFIFNIMQASAECNIVWTGHVSGSRPTNKTSRTLQAAKELYNYLPEQECGIYTASFKNNCYGFYFFGYRFETSKWVCTDGSWEGDCCIGIFPCYTIGGSWDVVCTTPTPCAAEAIYGENSEQIEMLRAYRDNILSKTPEGQELIKTYYKFSPTVTEFLERNPVLKNKAKRLIESMLPGIREKVEESNKEN
jgi:hypothetical protein